MRYIDTNTLDQNYEVSGSFYNIEYGTSTIVNCRNLLEIKLKNSESKKVDAIIVMMNPGSSEPVNFSPPIYAINEIQKQGGVPVNLVLTKPDDTQYQIMRIMDSEKWEYVKVINLSDIRDSNSTSFCNKLSTLSNDIHSIFSDKRKTELNGLLKGDRIIVAWGVNTKLRNLISLALENKFLSSRLGNPKNSYKRCKNFYYYHPLPRGYRAQRVWLRDILNKL